jgi:hypothetical protein
MNLNRNSCLLASCLILSHVLGLVATPAGVLPYAQYNGKHVILLGVDHHRPGYWIDFGGQSDGYETPVETAAREFSEETMYCFYPNLADVQNKLKSVVPLVVPNGYHMYLLEVPFVPSLNEIQYNLRASHHIKGRPGSGYNWLMAHHVEKIDYAWVYADDLKSAFAKAKGNHKKIVLKSIEGRTIILHELLVKSLSCSQAQRMLNAL